MHVQQIGGAQNQQCRGQISELEEGGWGDRSRQPGVPQFSQVQREGAATRNSAQVPPCLTAGHGDGERGEQPWDDSEPDGVPDPENTHEPSGQ